MKNSLLRAAAAALLMAATSTYGAASTWNGTVSVNWTNAASWGPGIPNGGDDVIIADTTGSGSALTLNDASHTNGLLQFGTTGTRNAVFTINGSSTGTGSTILTLTNGILSNYGAGIANGLSIKCPVTVGNDQTWTATGTVPLTTADYGIVLAVGVAGTARPLILNGTLTKAGNGELVLIGQNVGNGNIVVNGGWLKLNAGSTTLLTVGGTGTITVNNGATFMIAKNSGTLSVTKAIALNNGATFRLGGNSGALQTVGSPITFNGNVPWVVDYASLLLDFTGVWSGSVTSTITGNGGTNSYWANNSGLSGSINNSGTFKMRFGATNSASAAVAYGLNNGGAFYEIYGPATNISLGSLSGSAGILRNSNTNGQPATVTVGALNTSTTFGGSIADNTSSLALTKVGSGTLALTASTNTFSGGTTISGGGIQLLGASATLGSGPVTVQAGALLSGSGTASGAVTLAAGGSAEADGGAGAPPLNVGSLTCGATGTDLTTNNLNVYLGGKIANTGALVVNGTNIINILGAAPAVAVYDLITYTGGSIGGAGFAGFQLGALPYGVVANLQDSGTAVQLNVTAVTVEAGIWVGNALGQWNLAGGLEWKGANSSNPQPYHDADNVVFNDVASTFTPNITANVAPTSVLLTNSANTYTFSGVGSIVGGGSVFKDLPGTVIFANPNAYTGGTYITNGTIQIGNGGTNGSISGPVLDNGSLVFNRSDAVALAGSISGSGTVIQTGTSNATLSGANTYTGLTIAKSGILRAGNATAFGDIVGSTVVSNGASLDENAQQLTAEPIEAIGAGVGGIGAIVNNGGDQTAAMRFVTLAGNTTFGGSGRWDIRNPTPASDLSGGTLAFLHGNGYDLTKVGSNIVAFISVGDTALGNIAVQSGILTFSRSTIMGDSSKTITVYPGATFRMHRTAEFSANNLNKVVSMTNAIMEVEAAGLTNTFLGPITMTGTNTINLPGGTGLMLQNSIGGNSALLINTSPNSSGLLALQVAASAPLGTTLGGGILEVDGALTTPTFLITGNSTLMGNGSISAPVTIPSGSALSPGDSIGNLVINNTLVLSAGCSNVFEINKDLSTNDVVSGLTSVSYGGTLLIANVGTTGYAPGDSFKLFNAGSYSGSFSSIIPATPALGLIWVTSALTTSGTISVAVLPNPVPLTALSASSLVSTNIHVLFSAALDPTTAQDPSNYIYTNGSTVISATLLGTSNVVLGLDFPITNSTYTLKVKTVQDQLYVPDVIATTNVPGMAIDFLESTSILITNGSAFAFGTQSVVKVYSDGADIFGTQDHFQFVYKYVTGDFDLSVQLESLRISDPAAKAGIMARDVTDPVFPLFDDRNYLVAGFTADPARNNNFTQYREAQGGTGIAPGAPRPGATYPTNWLRLKRTGSFLQGFSGPNGWDWTPMTAVDSSTNTAGAYPDTIRVGLAATAHNAAQTTEAIFSKFGKAHERGILTGVQIGPDMVLSWQTNAIGAALQSTPSLSAPISWNTVPGSTLTNVIHSTIGPSNLFFRLAQ